MIPAGRWKLYQRTYQVSGWVTHLGWGVWIAIRHRACLLPGSFPDVIIRVFLPMLRPLRHEQFSKENFVWKAVVFPYLFSFDTMLLKIKSFPPLIFHLKKNSRVEYFHWAYQILGRLHSLSSTFRRTEIIGVAQASGQHWLYLCPAQSKKKQQPVQHVTAFGCLLQSMHLCSGGLLLHLLPPGASLASHHLAH